MAQFRGGVNELMRQAARMQRKLDEVKNAAKDREISTEALGGKVKVTVTLGRQVKRVELDPEFVKSEGLEMALDGACAALNQALEQAEKAMEAELEKVTGGVKIPGMV
jgi:DNA-binding YbaB/EbfC family protein